MFAFLYTYNVTDNNFTLPFKLSYLRVNNKAERSHTGKTIGMYFYAESKLQPLINPLRKGKRREI